MNVEDLKRILEAKITSGSITAEEKEVIETRIRAATELDESDGAVNSEPEEGAVYTAVDAVPTNPAVPRVASHSEEGVEYAVVIPSNTQGRVVTDVEPTDDVMGPPVETLSTETPDADEAAARAARRAAYRATVWGGGGGQVGDEAEIPLTVEEQPPTPTSKLVVRLSSTSLYDNVDSGTDGAFYLADDQRGDSPQSGVNTGSGQASTRSAGMTDEDAASFATSVSPDSLLTNRSAILALFDAANIPDIYHDVEQIGKGAAATVHRAVEMASGVTVALKKFKTMMLPETGHGSGALASNEEDLADIITEVRIMKRCNHDNVLRLRDAVVETSSAGYTFWASLDYCFGSCFELFKLLGRALVEEEIVAVTCQVLNGLDYLHFKRIMHRDIKCGNILVTAAGAAVLADFGVSIDLTSVPSDCCGTFVGSPYWIAPEVVLAMEDGTYSYPADVWSLGISIIEMSATEPPNFKMHAMSVLYNIPEGPPPRLDESGAFTPQLREFVGKCLVLEPANRLNTAALLTHPALAQVRSAENGRVALADLLEQALVARERRELVSQRAQALGSELQRMTASGTTASAVPETAAPSPRRRAQTAPSTPSGKKREKAPLVTRVKGFFKGRRRRKKKKADDAASAEAGGDLDDEDDAIESELAKISFGASIKGAPVSEADVAETQEVAFEMRKLRQQSTRRRHKKPAKNATNV